MCYRAERKEIKIQGAGPGMRESEKEKVYTGQRERNLEIGTWNQTEKPGGAELGIVKG